MKIQAEAPSRGGSYALQFHLQNFELKVIKTVNSETFSVEKFELNTPEFEIKACK